MARANLYDARYRAIVAAFGAMGAKVWAFEKTSKLQPQSEREKRREQLWSGIGRDFRELAMDKGGLIVKLGQHLSTHVEVIPPAMIAQIQDLQDVVAPVPTEEIITVVEQQLGAPIGGSFRDFSHHCLGAASLAQVHAATLHDGRSVAVKVLRPGIDELIECDLAAIKTSLKMLERGMKLGDFMDTDAFMAEFEETSRNELDLGMELANARLFKDNLHEIERVYVPEVYPDYSAQRVLTLEYVEGIKVNDLKGLDAAGVDREKVAKTLIDIYARMVLIDAFFHADPHPGNVWVRPDSTVILLDFGMVGRVTEPIRDGFVRFAIGMMLRDGEAMTDSLQEMGFLRAGANTKLLGRALVAFADVTAAGSRQAAMGKAMSFSDGLRNNIIELMHSQPFQLPDNVTYLLQALMTVTEACSQLYPEIDLVAEVEPYARDLADVLGIDAGGWGFYELIDALRAQGPHYLSLLRQLPTVVEQAAHGETVVHLTSVQERHLLRSKAKQTTRITRSIAGATLTLGGMVLMGGNYPNVNKSIAKVTSAIGAALMLAQTSGKYRGITPHERRHTN